MSDSDDCAVAAAAVAIICEVAGTQNQRRYHRPCRYWVRPSIKEGRKRYSLTQFMEHLLLDDVDDLNLEYRCCAGFINFFRMNTSDFEHLLNMTGPKISKKDTSWRLSIPARERLAVTLRFLVSGDSYSSLAYHLKMSKQSISDFVPIVCQALIEALQDYIKMPQNEEQWIAVAKRFENKWNYPNCVGAMDGKHITIQAQENSGTEFFNFKNFFSIVMFAVEDANYNFIYANVGCQGRISDGGVINHTVHTHFKKALDDNIIHLPSSRALPQRSTLLPHVFVGDRAFQLTTNVMKPYSGLHDKGSTKRIFNYRLSRSRRVSENAFGILASSFRVFRRPMLLNPDTAAKVTLAAIFLHYYLRKSRSRNIYCSVGMLDMESDDTGKFIPGLWRKDPETSQIQDLPQVPRRSCTDAQTVRDEFAEYFVSEEGALHFQYEK